MKYLIKYFCLTFLFLWGTESYASHAAGADLSYTCLGNNRYQVQLRLYRDCNGIGFTQTAMVNVVGLNTCSGASQGLQLNLISTVEVPITCYSMTGQNTCNGGLLPGYEESTYQGILDLSAFPGGCAWSINYNSCCRNSAITNLVNPSSESMFVEMALLDSSVSCNSSPRFANMPIFVVCDSLPYTFSNSTIEPDGDSVVYSLATPLTGTGGPISYNTGFTSNNFLSTLSGVNFNPFLGQLNFSPDGNQVVAVDILVEEYRNGQLIGYTRRSMQIVITNCSNSSLALDNVSEVVNGNPVSHGTSTTFYACPGEDLHFTLNLSDIDTGDSISLAQSFFSLFQIYPNASININYPVLGSTNNVFVDIAIPAVQNNVFSLAFTDNACPLANTQSFGFSILPDTNCASISGRIAIDSNSNCLVSPLENPFTEGIVVITKGNFTTYTTPNSNGNYSAVVDTGIYTVNFVPNHLYWSSCASNVSANATTIGNNVMVDFPMEPFVSCPFMYVDIAAPVLVHCASNYYVVHYCNYGTIDALNASVEVTLDSLFVIDSTELPISSQTGFTYTFNLGTVPVGACANFRIYGVLDNLCDTANMGRTHCATAHIYPDSFCLTNPLWSGANLQVEARCDTDSVAFRIINTGGQGMALPQSYWVIEDDIIFYTGPGITLPSGGSSPWESFPADGSTYRMAITQVPNHPWGTEASATVEGCLSISNSGNPISTGFVNIFSLNDGSPFYSIDCQQNVGSWDPNDKQGFPIGYHSPHYITDDVELEYRIRFQNTGTYPATNIVLLDSLSPYLDPSSFIPSASSHPYTWRMLRNGIIEFRFNNIMLPDSGSNLAGSHGFVDFRIKQQANNPIGTVIYNQAAIYFDQNPAVITNQTYHTIGENFIQITGLDEVLVPEVTVKVFPNPFQYSTTISIESETAYEEINLQVFDATGRLIQNIQNETTQQLTLHRKNMNPGIYLYRLVADGQLLHAGKLIVH